MFAQKLFNDLMNLVKEENSPFYHVNQYVDGAYYRVFSYRLANYTDFCKENALECRGHMFETDDAGNFIRLASLPMSKFFNLHENPMTMDLDLSVADLVMDKHDGSLISTFLHNKNVRLKSKTSVSSEQAVAATNLLNSEKYKNLLKFVQVMENNDYTVNMEYESPKNRIVLSRQEDSLVVLNARSRVDGSYMRYSILKALMQEYDCANSIVRDVAYSVQNLEEFLTSVKGMTGIEGFVVVLPSGLTFKIKTEWYSVLHHLKDNVNSTKRLFECVVSEASDDLRAQFHDDEFIIKKIDHMENIVRGINSDFNYNVVTFYNENKHLDRKSYAILGQNTLKAMYFPMAMNLYLNKELDVKAWMLKNYLSFGIKDESTVEE